MLGHSSTSERRMRYAADGPGGAYEMEASMGDSLPTPSSKEGDGMSYNEEVFSRQYPVVVFFVQHLAYYEGLWATFENISDHRHFWRSTCDGHLKLAAVAWCEVFGSNKEDTHWTRTPSGNTDANEDFRRKVLCDTGLTQAQWSTYHKEMLDFRSKYVAHLDLHKPFDGPVPRFHYALQVTYTYQEWIRDVIRPVLLNQPTLRSQYEQWKAEACSVVAPPCRG